MTGEIQGWKDTADSILASFGDVVRDATVSTVTQGSFDRNTGGYAQTTTTITTKVVPSKRSREFIASKGSYAANFYAFIVRGSDFTTLPNPQDELTVDGVTYAIEEVEFDSARTGAYFKLYVQKR